MRRPTYCRCGRRGPDTDAPVGSRIWANCPKCRALVEYIVREVAAVVG